LIAWFLSRRRRSFQSNENRGFAYRSQRSIKMNFSQNKSASLFLAAFVLTTQSCSAQETPLSGKEVSPGVRLIGRIAHPRLTECSGVVASRHHPGVLWTHTDGGGPRKQVLFAMGFDGRSLGEFHVADVLLADWEDIAIDDQKHLFIADTGNNDLDRLHFVVHQLDEPDPNSKGVVHPTRTWRLRFPGEGFDCESLFVWHGHGYLVSKVSKDARAQIFRFPMSHKTDSVVLELVATTKVESPVTGADISPDGRLLGLVAKSGAFVYRIDGEVARVGKGKPFQTKFRHEQIEGCAFVPEGLLATAESREIYLYTAAAFRSK
jgi:hypothetical protein